MERMSSNSQVEAFLARCLDEVSRKRKSAITPFTNAGYGSRRATLLELREIRIDDALVGANAGCLQSFRAQLFVLVRNQVDAERELVDGRSFPTKVKDANLRIRDTSIESRLWVWLKNEDVSTIRGFFPVKPTMRQGNRA